MRPAWSMEAGVSDRRVNHLGLLGINSVLVPTFAALWAWLCLCGLDIAGAGVRAFSIVGALQELYGLLTFGVPLLLVFSVPVVVVQTLLVGAVAEAGLSRRALIIVSGAAGFLITALVFSAFYLAISGRYTSAYWLVMPAFGLMGGLSGLLSAWVAARTPCLPYYRLVSKV